MRTFLAGTSGAAQVGRAGAMILAGLTCMRHGRPLPGNLGLGTDCLLMAPTAVSCFYSFEVDYGVSNKYWTLYVRDNLDQHFDLCFRAHGLHKFRPHR